METYFSLGQVARLLGVAPHRIVYLHTAGKLPEPQRVFGNRAYRWSEVAALAERFAVDLTFPGTGTDDGSNLGPSSSVA